jgi:hypothetical protein
MTRHQQIRVKAPEWTFRQRISVDAGMAPLLREIWCRGYMTWASCQDWGDGTAQIVFFGESMARAFCYEAIRQADDLPDGWRRKVMGAPFPGSPPLCAVWFPRELLARFAVKRAA